MTAARSLWPVCGNRAPDGRTSPGADWTFLLPKGELRTRRSKSASSSRMGVVPALNNAVSNRFSSARSLPAPPEAGLLEQALSVPLGCGSLFRPYLLIAE